MMTSSRTAGLLLVLAAAQGSLLAQAGNDGQAAPTPQSTPAKGEGTVLFERHAEPVEQTAEPASDDAEEAQPVETGRQGRGVSSSRHHARAVLHRRGESAPRARTAADGATPMPATPSGVPLAYSSSAGSDATVQQFAPTSEDLAAASAITSAERKAVRITGRDLDLHLDTHTGKAEVHARVTVRNASSTPLAVLPLRISGALHWESAHLVGETSAAVKQHRVQDDLDHTGVANEVALPLRAALLPGSSVQVDVYYAGSLVANTDRLMRLGAPAGRAALTDWDTVSDTFTGLRGEGNVLWYPVAGAPALLRNGSAVPDAVGQSRATEWGSSFHLRLSAEYTGAPPTAAYVCGERQSLTTVAADTPEGGIAVAEWTRTTLGAHTPSLFLTSAPVKDEAEGLLQVATDNPAAATALGTAATSLRPMLQEWLGSTPAQKVTVLDLPVPGAAPFADGALLVQPLSTESIPTLTPTLVQPLAAAWLPDGIAAAWLREGIPEFLQAVYVERTAGRGLALAGLRSSLQTLTAQAAPAVNAGFSSSQASPMERAAGPALALCTAPACARMRAAYVFEMLDTMLGSAALQQVLSGWAVQQAAQPGRSAAVETSAMEQLLQQVAGKRDLQWFFTSWIDEDRSLPELQIVTVAPRRIERSSPTDIIATPRKPVAGPIGAEPVTPTDPRDMGERDAAAYAAAHSNDALPGSWLVAVEVQNNGGADAEVPVTVSAGGLVNTLPLRVPAHGRATIRVPFEAAPEEVQVNDGSVPEGITVQHRRTLRNLPR